jgi:hypothetical protein
MIGSGEKYEDCSAANALTNKAKIVSISHIKSRGVR